MRNTPPMDTWSSGVHVYTPNSSLSAAQTQRDASKARLTYGGFIFLLQNLGINPQSVRTTRFSIPIGRGTYFAVYKQRARPVDFLALDLFITKPPAFRRRFPDPNTWVAIKRVRVRDETGSMEVSDQGQLHAICQEVQALVHPALREHESIIKLQAVIWENGPGSGSESGLPMWPTLVMEYCETTLADYQLTHPPLAAVQLGVIGSKIGDGLDALHSANIFHGDLKSENVLVKIEADGVLCPKLADFGCSIMVQDDDGKTKYWVAGTPLWWAPECPNYFTSIGQIEATDCYSLGLLLLRLQCHGRNPFEDLGVIPSDWTIEEKLAAAQFMKKTDCLSAILNDASTKIDPSLSGTMKMLAILLLRDPIERMKAFDVDVLGDVASTTLLHIQQNTDINIHQNELDELSMQVERYNLSNEEAEASSVGEQTEVLDTFSILTSLSKTSLIPDCIALSKIPRSAQLNKATTGRLVDELLLTLSENADATYPKRCEGCCTSSFLDTEGSHLEPDTLLERLQGELLMNADKHTCAEGFKSDTTAEDWQFSASMFGGGMSDVTVRTWTAIYQLYLATATGFGTPQSETQALKLLEDALTSGFANGAASMCLYAKYTKQTISPTLPLRKALVSTVLFSAGIPSDAFLALETFDPLLAEITAEARSRVYNGSTASFDNIRFNSMNLRDVDPETLPGFFLHDSGTYLVQDEVFENSLLHLIAGSCNPDTSLIGYCIDTLGINKDLRNKGGATPLLMACRAGRESMILALLRNNANVNLDYPAGETPLHWLAMLSKPHRILKEFVRRGADINAQATESRLLPNYLGGTARFFVKGTPLFWAIAVCNENFIEALLNEGADIHMPGPTGLSPITYACRPGKIRSLKLLAKDKAFQVSRNETNTVMTQWTTMDMLTNFVTPTDQESCLEFVLSSAIPFKTVEDVEDFYRFLVPHVVSECRVEIVEIVLNALSLSIATLPDSNENITKYAVAPLSNPAWVQHRLVHEAAKTGDAAVLESVLRWGGEATALDGFTRSTLHVLSFHSDNAECVDILINHGAASYLDMKLEIEGLTAFSNAIVSGNYNVADRLLSYTPLDERKKLLSSGPCEMAWYNFSLMGHLIGWCSDIGEQPIEYLFSLPELRDNPDLVFIVDELNNRSALMMACGLQSETTIHNTETFVAARWKRTVQLLLRKFPEKRHLDWRDNNNNTALITAAYIGSADIASELITAGADINLVNNLGFSALDILFGEMPGFLRSDLQLRKLMLEPFEKGRNSICMELRSLGARHHHPIAVRAGWTRRLPYLEVRTEPSIILAYEIVPGAAWRRGGSGQPRERRDSEDSID